MVAVRSQLRPESSTRTTQSDVQHGFCSQVLSLAWDSWGLVSHPSPSLSVCLPFQAVNLGFLRVAGLREARDFLHGGWLLPAFMLQETTAGTARLLGVWP